MTRPGKKFVSKLKQKEEEKKESIEGTPADVFQIEEISGPITKKYFTKLQVRTIGF